MALTPIFHRNAEAAAAKMVTSLFTDAGKTWREAARVNARGREIYEALQVEMYGSVGARVRELTMQNAELIKTLPLSVARDVTRHIEFETEAGRRASDMVQELKGMALKSARAKANLIARTEVSKTNTALTQARCENLGVRWYIWRTEKDARVRESHRIMDGVIINWGDPPSPEELDGEKSLGKYHAGNIFNCRCYPEPLTRMDLVKWPHKVYYRGKIQTLPLARFEKIGKEVR
jgi:SPP1 gp7 family putative phage head morphogenesis protein